MLMALLSACSTKNYKTKYLTLPDYPLVGELAAKEFKKVCNDDNCYYLNEWFNRLRKFNAEYEIIKNNIKITCPITNSN